MDALYELGKLQVPLSAILPAEQCDHSQDLATVLRNPAHLLACSITSEGREALLRRLGWDLEQLHNAETVPLISDQPITCTFSRRSLDQAKVELGRGYTCNIQLYCVPPKPQRTRDGVAFRNIRLYMAKPDATRIAVAQAWMNTLTGPKKHALALMLKRPLILAALDGMLPFPGHWDGMQLGNWTKHLAAHIDPAIDNYWAHMKATWAKIMLNDETMYHLVTTNDVKRLQHRAPAWSSSDRHYIQNAFAARQLFPLVHEASKREKILHNILELQCVIPSIQTFHENMRYITIGAKILERVIQMPRRNRRTKDAVDPGSVTLFDNLVSDWGASRNVVQIADGQYAERQGPPEPYVAFLVLFLAALRNFPHLSSEKALLGNEKEENREQPQIREHIHLLCTVARGLGFHNKKIERGCAIDCGQVQASPAYRPPLGWGDWRAGKPSIVAHKILAKRSFFLNIYAGPPPETSQLSPFHILSDLMRAFFPYHGSISAVEATTAPYTEDAAMSDIDYGVEDNNLGNENGGEDDTMDEDASDHDLVDDMQVDQDGEPHILQKVQRKPAKPLAKPKPKAKRNDRNKLAGDKQIPYPSQKKLQKVSAGIRRQPPRQRLKRRGEDTDASNAPGPATGIQRSSVAAPSGIEIPSVQTAVEPLDILRQSLPPPEGQLDATPIVANHVSPYERFRLDRFDIPEIHSSLAPLYSGDIGADTLETSTGMPNSGAGPAIAAQADIGQAEAGPAVATQADVGLSEAGPAIATQADVGQSEAGPAIATQADVGQSARKRQADEVHRQKEVGRPEKMRKFNQQVETHTLQLSQSDGQIDPEQQRQQAVEGTEERAEEHEIVVETTPMEHSMFRKEDYIAAAAAADAAARRRGAGDAATAPPQVAKPIGEGSFRFAPQRQETFHFVATRHNIPPPSLGDLPPHIEFNDGLPDPNFNNRTSPPSYADVEEEL